MGKSQPAAPDPVATANAQAAMNRETAITQFGLNAVNQVNPTGTVTYDQIGTWEDGTPRFQQTTSYTPEQQAIFDSSQAAMGNLAGLASEQSAFLQDYLNTPFEFTNDDAAQWAYDLASPRILQQQGQNEDALRTTLANKGIREGSAAWDAEMARMTNANTDQLNQLALTGRSQAFSEAMAARNQPINEITALLSGSQVSNPAAMSSATPQTGVAGVDYAGIVNQNYQNRVNATNQANSAMGGLFGSVLGVFSDRRLKTDIRRIGRAENGLNVYEFRYKPGSASDDGGVLHRGVMAQEVAEVMPEAVIYTEHGMMVDYGRIG